MAKKDKTLEILQLFTENGKNSVEKLKYEESKEGNYSLVGKVLLEKSPYALLFQSVSISEDEKNEILEKFLGDYAKKRYHAYSDGV